MGQKHGMCTERQVEMDPLRVDDECFAHLLAQWVLSLVACYFDLKSSSTIVHVSTSPSPL